jgi:ATP-dependent helicase HrpB
LSALDQWNDVPAHVHRVAREVETMAASILRDERGSRTTPSEAGFLQAVFAGYPDRVAKRRQPGSRNVKLASGAGAVVGAESGVNDGDYLVAVDVHQRSGSRSAERNPDEDVIVRIASRADQSWLKPLEWETAHVIDSGVVRASAVGRYGSIVVEERPTTVDPAIASDLLVTAWMERGPDDADRRLLQRAQFARIVIDTAAVIRTVAERATSLDSITLRSGLSPDVQRALDRIAPEHLLLPSGRSVALEYGDDGRVTAAAKLQELFGLAETPVLGPDRTPVTLALLAPNGQPVQVTQDLRSFWNRTYPEVRKELRGRYPRHPWPEDPWTATPSARTARRSSRR